MEGIDPNDAADQAVELFDRGVTALASQQFDDAVLFAHQAADAFIAVDGPTSPDGANALMTEAEALSGRTRQGDLQEAARLFDRAATMLSHYGNDGGGPLDDLVLRARRGIGNTACAEGRYADAAVALRDALVHADVAFGPESAEVGYVCNDLGVLGKFAAHFDEAEQWYRRALRIAEATSGPRTHDTATIHHNLAGLAHSRQRSADGLASGYLSVEIRRALVGDDHLLVAADRANLGGLLLEVGAVDEAEACFEAARRIYESAFDTDHVEVAIAWHNLAAVAAARGDTDSATELYRRALDAKTRTLGATHPSTLITAVNLARLVDDDTEACVLFRRAVDTLAGSVSEDHRTLIAARCGLAERRTARS